MKLSMLAAIALQPNQVKVAASELGRDGDDALLHERDAEAVRYKLAPNVEKPE